MKHCHAPAASLKPNTSKNLTSSRWSCTWSRSCLRNTKHKEHKLIYPPHSILGLGRGCVEAGRPVLNLSTKDKEGALRRLLLPHSGKEHHLSSCKGVLLNAEGKGHGAWGPRAGWWGPQGRVRGQSLKWPRIFLNPVALQNL